MVSELCLKFKCKECPEQTKCFGCEHNYIIINKGTSVITYKCSKCGKVLKLDKKNVCNECVNKCKGRVKSVITVDKVLLCNGFRNNIEKD